MSDVEDKKEPAYHQQRLETLGLLAGSVAHDFNNVLTGILGHISFLRLNLPAEGSHTHSLKIIEDSAKKAAALTHEILNFSRPESSARAAVSLTKVIEGSVCLLRGSFFRDHTIDFNLPVEPYLVDGAEQHLMQVVINLLINAKDASPKGSAIKLELSSVKLNEINVTDLYDAGKLSGEFVLLEVIDTGCGMTDVVRRQVLNRYFSTKGILGNGLGLTSACDIVKAHDGAMHIESTPGVGSRVAVYLPVSSSHSRIASASTNSPALEGGREKILVVDDESSVRDVISIGLEQLGYYVEAAESGEVALAKLIQDRTKFDLIILDMVMPKISGTQVFETLKSNNITGKILVSTAYAPDQAIRNIMSHEGVGLIRKPFTLDELAVKVRQCLGI